MTQSSLTAFRGWQESWWVGRATHCTPLANGRGPFDWLVRADSLCSIKRGVRNTKLKAFSNAGFRRKAAVLVVAEAELARRRRNSAAAKIDETEFQRLKGTAQAELSGRPSLTVSGGRQGCFMLTL